MTSPAESTAPTSPNWSSNTCSMRTRRARSRATLRTAWRRRLTSSDRPPVFDVTWRLSNATLDELPADVARPRYERAAVATGIVHLGIGAFQRAHLAMYTEAALNVGDPHWGIVGASLRSPTVRDALKPQDSLYTLAVRGAEGER